MSNARKLGGLFGPTGSIDAKHGGVPAGVVLPFAGTTAPDGWLMCFGQAISRTTYAALFAAIGTAHGTGNGSTTFNVPDMRGRVAAGVDNMGGTAAGRLTTAGGVAAATLGAAGGGETHVLSAAQMPSHGHGISDPGHSHSVYDPGHSHGNQTLIPNYGFGLAPNVSDGGAYPTNMGAVGTGISIYGAATGVSVQANGGNGAHPNVQPTLALNSIIRAA